MTPNHLAIELVDVTKQYSDVLAADSVSFKVREGEFFGLLGPNGAGKTTTINMMTGLGSWGRNDQTIGTDTGNAIHSPNTTNAARYAIITNRKSSIYVNNAWSTNDQGTSLILMEVSS